MAALLKIGSDICSVNRIKTVYEKYGERFLNRVLTEREKAYVESSSSSNAALRSHRLSQALAARFAGKEAVAKALGSSLEWKEVEIINTKKGAPQVVLYGRAKRLLAELSLNHVEISLSHEQEYALAMVVVY